MKRKILILTFTFSFLVSTTGLPLTLHLCQMSDSEDVCEHIMVKKTTCCEEGQDNAVTLSKGNQNCCSTELVNHKVDDEFLSFKTQTTNSPVFNFFYPTINQQDIFLSLNSKLFFSDSSPPFLSNNHIYLNISLLLI